MLLTECLPCRYLPLLNDLRTPRTQTTRVKHKAVPEFADMFDDRVLVGSLNGTVASLKWDGSELTVSDIIKRDSIKTVTEFRTNNKPKLVILFDTVFSPISLLKFMTAASRQSIAIHF